MNYIFIDSKEGINRIGIIEDNRLVEFYTEEIENESIVGNVYRARVLNVLSGMEAAFVDIGEEKNAFLYLKDSLSKEQLYTKEKYRISDILKGGEETIVQVVKEPLGSKGPKVTTHISIPGRYIVLTPYSHKINISRKINNEEEVNRLKSIGNEIKEDNIGIIFRTNAENIEKDKLYTEYKNLLSIYRKIEKERTFLPTPKLIYKELDLAYQIVRDTFNDRNFEIIVNSKDVYNKLITYEENFAYGLKDKIILNKDFSIDNNMQIQMDIKEALDRKVPLKSGGSIVIDETEALTAIDVNTGKFVGGFTLGDTVLKTNLEAVVEIARQVRLRDIGGIIIVDFIDMKDKDHISTVVSKMSDAFNRDRNKPHIIDVTKLCLVEITRKKIRPTLDRKTSVICPTCNGRGRIRNI